MTFFFVFKCDHVGEGAIACNDRTRFSNRRTMYQKQIQGTILWDKQMPVQYIANTIYGDENSNWTSDAR